MTEPFELDAMAGELEQAAQRLRSGELEAGDAAALIDECARLAAQAASQVEREARASEPSSGQDSLL